MPADDRTYSAIIDLSKSFTEHRVEFAHFAGKTDERLSQVESVQETHAEHLDSMRPKLASLADADATGKTRLAMTPVPDSGALAKARYAAIVKLAPWIGAAALTLIGMAGSHYGCTPAPVVLPVPLPVSSGAR